MPPLMSCTQAAREDTCRRVARTHTSPGFRHASQDIINNVKRDNQIKPTRPDTKNFSRICEDFSPHHSNVQSKLILLYLFLEIILWAVRHRMEPEEEKEMEERERERETKRLHQLDSLHQEILLIVMSYIYTHTNTHRQKRLRYRKQI
ncbi:hypothetical protein MN608_11125 [Microdochium nivale]|nr:hypothetical protein MN608_11125 [Microdochium nivale]